MAVVDIFDQMRGVRAPRRPRQKSAVLSGPAGPRPTGAGRVSRNCSTRSPPGVRIEPREPDILPICRDSRPARGSGCLPEKGHSGGDLARTFHLFSPGGPATLPTGTLLAGSPVREWQPTSPEHLRSPRLHGQASAQPPLRRTAGDYSDRRTFRRCPLHPLPGNPTRRPGSLSARVAAAASRTCRRGDQLSRKRLQRAAGWT